MKQKLANAQQGRHIDDTRIVDVCQNRRSRMRNDGAAIIALSRSKSQHLTSIPLEREGVIVYDERTEL